MRKNVPLVHVGEEWQASTGKVTFTREHLAAAIAAFDDPAVRTPIIKLGHKSTLNDGEPALGRLINPMLSEDGMDLLADEAGLPPWLDDGMATLFPRRSVEGRFNYTTASGRTHAFMLTAVALLGSAYPAITTLDDVQLLMEAESIEDFDLVAATELSDNTVQGTEKGPERPMATTKKVTGRMNTWEHATVRSVSTSKSGMVELHTAAGTSLLDMDGTDPRRAMAALNTLSAEDG